MKFKVISILLLVLAWVNACALLHFFSPAAQNAINRLSVTEGWVKIGGNISNTIGSFCLDVNSAGIPYVVHRDYNNFLVLYKYDNGWNFVSSNTLSTVFSKPVLHLMNDIPYVAYIDNQYKGWVYSFQNPIAVLMTASQFGTGIYEFDYTINANNQHLVSFTLTNTYLAQIFGFNGSSWGYISPFPTSNVCSGNFVQIDKDLNNNVYILCPNSISNTLNYSDPNGKTVWVFSEELQFAVGGDKIFYVFRQQAASYILRFVVKNTSSPYYNTNESYVLNNNADFVMANDAIVASKKPPYMGFCLIKPVGSTSNIMTIINENSVIKNVALPAVEGNIVEAALFSTSDGGVYLIVKEMIGADEFLAVYRYFYAPF